MTCIENEPSRSGEDATVSSDNRFKVYLAIFCAVAILGSTAIITLNWWIDPLQFYRKASYPPFFSGHKRFELPGLAKNYEYDAVVVGTSLSENFRRKSLQSKLGFHSMNFAIQGASSREQSLMLQVALRTGNVKNVIWDIQYEYLRGHPKRGPGHHDHFPENLYDENPFNEIHRYLLNVDTTKRSLKVLLRKLGLYVYPDRDIEEIFTWDTKRKFGIASIRKAREFAKRQRDYFRQRINEYTLDNLNANFDASFLDVIKKHPEVTFYLYLPPYAPSYYFYLQETSPDIFENMLANKRHIFDQTRGLKNVRLHDFQVLPDAICDLENYCDSMHFNSNVSEYIIESMATSRHIAFSSNVEELKSFIAGPKTSAWMEKLSN